MIPQACSFWKSVLSAYIVTAWNLYCIQQSSAVIKYKAEEGKDSAYADEVRPRKRLFYPSLLMDKERFKNFL